jgi:anaerobic selenocysteine-containing dehydrogenase
MSPHGNLAEHLIECLNIVCGRLVREGEEVQHPGAIQARTPRRAEVIPALRPWEEGPQSRVGDFGLIGGELPSGTLADEMLEPGPGRLRGFITHGGNPVSAVPELEKVVRAFESLELHVAIEPFMTISAELAHYVLPPTLQYERADLPVWLFESMASPEPYTRYTPPIAKPPRGAQVRDDHYYFWAIAKRLGLELRLFGESLDMQSPPTTDALLALTARDAPIDFDALKRAERGVFLDHERVVVEPGDPESPHRFSLMPEDVRAELAEVEARLEVAPLGEEPFRYRLAVRRLRDANNSAGLSLPSIKARVPFNPAFMNPEDMSDEGWKIEARAKPDPALRRGVVSIPHGFGALPRSNAKYDDVGSSTNHLTSLDDEARERINAMPHMTGIPVSVRPVETSELRP